MTLIITELHSLRRRFPELHSLRCETHVSRTDAEQLQAPSLSAVQCARMNLSQPCHHSKYRSALLPFLLIRFVFACLWADGHVANTQF